VKVGDLVRHKQKTRPCTRRGIVLGFVKSEPADVWVMWTDDTRKRWEYVPYLEVISESR